jgi:WD40 repeat protein
VNAFPALHGRGDSTGGTMVSLYPRHWSICRIAVAGSECIAYADKRRILLWDPVAEQTRVLASARGPTLALCPVRTGGRTLLASAGKGGGIRLWDPAGGREVARFTGHPSRRINALCTLPDEHGDLLISAGNDGLVIASDPRTGRPGPPMADGGSAVEDVCRVRVDGADRLASVGLDGVVRIWDPVSASLVRAMPGHPGALRAVCALTVDGRPLVAVAGEGFVITVWDPATGDLVRTLEPRSTPHTLSATVSGGGTIFALCRIEDSDGGWLAAGGDFPGVWLWNPRTGRGAGWIGWGGFLDTTPACGWIRSLATYRHKDEPAIATGGYDKEVHSFRAYGAAAFSGF